MKTLVLAEKPSVGRDLARVLGCRQQHKTYIEGSRYIVTWALGHLVELKMPEDYDKRYETWRMEDLPIIPEQMELKVIRKTSAQFKAIQKLTKRKDIKELVIATDAGREGELVARWIIKKIHWRKPVKRLWISSQTDRAIREGFKQLKPAHAYDALYASAVCRAEADWLIGLNVTRALTTKYDDPLSAGRVQTPTLNIILEREHEIETFVPKEFRTLTAHFGSFSAQWEQNGDKRLFDLERAEQLSSTLKGEKGVVRSVKQKTKREPQPLPYDLTELQRDANRRYGFSAKKTLNILQQLYEYHKLITYPRTDSRYLTKDMETTMPKRLKALSDGYRDEVKLLLGRNAPLLAKRVFNDHKVTDHHAIIPTDEPLVLSDLSADERKVYDMIVRRFLALFHPPHRYSVITAVIDIAGETFVTHETREVERGFTVVMRQERAAANQSEPLPLKEGQTVVPKDIVMEKGYTEPPARLNEADLLARMEKHGLGTPATRADIIERLLETEVVTRHNGRFRPTPKGKQLINLVSEELRSPELTSRWERELEAIARGKGNAKTFLANIRRQTYTLVNEIKTSDQTYRAYNLTGSKCPECEAKLKEVKRKNGTMLVCSNRRCTYRRRKDPVLSNRRCPQCRKRMEIHQGKAGPYFQCRSCNLVEKKDRSTGNVSKREERQLLKKYSGHESLKTNLGEALKAALQKREE